MPEGTPVLIELSPKELSENFSTPVNVTDITFKGPCSKIFSPATEGKLTFILEGEFLRLTLADASSLDFPIGFKYSFLLPQALVKAKLERQEEVVKLVLILDDYYFSSFECFLAV